MPMSEERSVLRKTLIGQLIETAAYNRNRKNESLALFEIGSVFHTDEERLTRLPQEKHRFAALLTGSKSEAGWNRKPQPYDFYDAKGVLETIFSVLGVEDAVSYVPAQPRHFHPGRTAAVVLNGVNGPETIGYVGQLHPSLQQDSDLGDTYLAEIALAPLYEVAGAEIAYKALPRYPAIGRDLAVVVGAEVPAASLLDAVKGEAGELLESVRVFDVYTGEKLGAGRKSVALSLVYRHAERTLTDEEVAGLQDKVMQKLEQSFAAELRK
jgi:Phenylalanyl-tRNA synthetase beta subunit